MDSNAGQIQSNPSIALRLDGTIVVIWAGHNSDQSEVLHCYTSTNQGKSFTPGTVRAFLPNPLYSTEIVPDRIMVDSSGSLLVYWKQNFADAFVGGTHRFLSKSSDGGSTFIDIWTQTTMCNRTISALQNSPAFTTPASDLYFVHDSCDGSSFPPTPVFLLLKKFESGDPLSATTFALPSQEITFDYHVNAAAVFNQDTIDYAFENTSPDSLMYYSRSVDGGSSFGALVWVDGPWASAPALARLSDGNTVLLYGSGGLTSLDSIITARIVNQTDLGAPFRLGPKKAAARGRKQLASDSSWNYLIYETAGPDWGTAYYMFDDIESSHSDSAFFAGYEQPDMAVDERGKYLVMVKQDKVYWTTKDIILDIEPKNREPRISLLHQNYPNPFNLTTHIRFTIANLTIVRIQVFDLLGREVATVVNEERPPGTYAIEWRASELPSGTYFYQLRAGDRTSTGRMVLLK